MKCPNCGTRISFWNIRNEFSCSHCKVRLKTTRFALALAAAVLFSALIFFPIISIFFSDINIILIDTTVGTLLSFLIIRSILKFEKIG
jgi:uncharacterized paraquat-inducible protein A